MVGAALQWRPLTWRDDVFVILDQAALPEEERYLECRTVEDVVAAIREMRVRGAPAIGISAVAGLALALRAETREPRAWTEVLEDAERLLATTRPTAVDLFHGLERARRKVAQARSAEEAASLLSQLTQDLIEQQWHIDRAIAEHGAALLPRGARVLTHCNTGALGTGAYGTALGIVRRLHELGRLAHVWVTETRPRLQGARLTAWELRRVGIDHTLIVDSAAAWLMARGMIDAVIVGADRIATNGDVANKIGTLSLAIAAERCRVPFYVAAPISTLDEKSADGSQIPIEERDENEVRYVGATRVVTEEVKVYNPAFDVTPAGLVTGLVTERGVVLTPTRARMEAFLQRVRATL